MQREVIDTAHATRHTVRLQTIDDLVAEVGRVTEAASRGRLRPLGNWSPAQVLWHVGRLIEFSFDGFPFRYRRGIWWLTLLLRWFAWQWLVRLAMRPGFTNPPEAAALE